MTKQWKRGLEQTDIVSDGEPFDGSYIDAPLSESGSGINLENTAVQAINSTGGQTTIDGGGILVRVITRLDQSLTIDIDGTEIYHFNEDNDDDRQNMFTYWFFGSELILESDGEYRAWVLLK